MLKTTTTPAQTPQQVADFLKTLAHPIRLQIVVLLTDQPMLNVMSLQAQLPVEQSVLSHHLIKMRDRGLLTSVRHGTEHHYRLADPGLGQFVKQLLG